MLDIIWDPKTPLVNQQIRITFPNAKSSEIFRDLANIDHDVIIKKIVKKKTSYQRTPIVIEISTPTVSELKHVIDILPGNDFILNIKMEH